MTTITASASYRKDIDQIWMGITTSDLIPKWVSVVESCTFDPQTALQPGAQVTTYIKTHSRNLRLYCLFKVITVDAPNLLVLDGNFEHANIRFKFALSRTSYGCNIETKVNYELSLRVSKVINDFVEMAGRQYLVRFLRTSLERLEQVSS